MTSLEEKDNKEINIEVRSKILEYSLIIEGAINTLLLAYLGIIGKSNTKLFGNKVGISFKSKIDLLYDIDVLSKKEHSALELQMIFRNKFIHALECNSFSAVLSQLDNGIKNRFKKYMDDTSKINNEETCKESYRKIYITNIDTILHKIELKRKSIEDKNDLIQLLLQKELRITDISFDFLDKLLTTLEEVHIKNTENKQIVELTTHLFSTCDNHSKTFTTDNELIELDKKLKSLLDPDKINEYLK